MNQPSHCEPDQRRLRHQAILLLALFLFVTSGLRAQVVNATLTGTVKDSSGAVIAGARVVATNLGTNLTHETVTDTQGNYRLPSLVPGQYKLQADLQGFKTSLISGITLQVAQQARVDVELQVGEVTQTLDVVGTAPVIDTESPTIGSVVDQKKMVEYNAITRHQRRDLNHSESGIPS